MFYLKMDFFISVNALYIYIHMHNYIYKKYKICGYGLRPGCHSGSGGDPLNVRTNSSIARRVSHIASGSRNKRGNAHQRVASGFLQHQWTAIVIRARSLGVQRASQRAQCVGICNRRAIEIRALRLQDDTDASILKRSCGQTLVVQASKSAGNRDNVDEVLVGLGQLLQTNGRQESKHLGDAEGQTKQSQIVGKSTGDVQRIDDARIEI